MADAIGTALAKEIESALEQGFLTPEQAQALLKDAAVAKALEQLYENQQTGYAQAGTVLHNAWAQAERQQTGEVQTGGGVLGGGWSCEGINRDQGDGRRPDYLYVNHETKQVWVVDLYTGRGGQNAVNTATGVESRSHYDKGWDYSSCPHIAAYSAQGYSYQYTVLNSNLVQ